MAGSKVAAVYSLPLERKHYREENTLGGPEYGAIYIYYSYYQPRLCCKLSFRFFLLKMVLK